MENTSDEITKTKTCSVETSLTSVTETGPVADYNLPLSEVVVISTAIDDNSRNDNHKTTADKIQTAEKGSREISLIATTDNRLVPIASHKHPPPPPQ